MNRSAFAAVAVACTTAVRIVGCGGSSGSSTTSPTQGGTATVLMGTAPDFLDPQGDTRPSRRRPPGSRHAAADLPARERRAGHRADPRACGAAADLIRRQDLQDAAAAGLVFSNEQRVKASDFAYTIERAMKLNWGGKSFFTGYVVGASPYDRGASKTISGIRTDDATGRITIHLTKRSGAFGNVLAFPAAGAESLSSGPEGGSPVFAIGH